MMMCRVVWLLWVCLLLSACVNKRAPELPPGQAWLKPGVAVTLPAPAIAPGFTVQQLLTARFNGQEHSLMTMLEADGERLVLVGLSTLGVRLFKLVYDEKGVQVDQSIVLPEMPPPTQVLADIMLAYWPLTAWQPLLPVGWVLEDTGSKRLLRDASGAIVSEVGFLVGVKGRQPVYIRQHSFNYEIHIENLSE